MSLIVWLPLTKDLRQQGLSNIEVTNNGATYSSTGGKLGGCYSFGTSTSYLTLNSEPLKNFNKVSVACWIKINTWNTSYATIVHAKNGTGFSWANIIFGLSRYGGNNALCFTIANGSSSTSGSVRTGTLNTEQWYHICCTYEPGIVKMYQDGELVDSATTSIVPAFDTIANCFIGTANGNAYQLKALLNDFRIYDHALSPMEVKQISQGLVLHYPLNREGWGQENLITQAMINAEPWKSAISGTYTIDGKTGWILSNNQLYSKSGNGANNIFSGLTYEENTQYTISFKWRDDYRTDGKSSSLYIRFKYSDGTYSQVILPKNDYWKEEVMTSTAGKTVSAITTTYGNGGNLLFTDLKLEKGAIKTFTSPIVNSDLYNSMGFNSTTEYDCSGFCNNGTRTGTFDWISDTPKYQVSTKLTTGSKITSSTGMITTANPTFTCNFWIKMPSATYTKWADIITFPGSAIIRMETSNTAGTSLSWYNYPIGTSSGIGTNGVVNNTDWNMFTLTCDGVNWKTYRNGVLVNTVAISGTAWTPNGTVSIGDNGMYAQLSDVRIYATALSADDVKALYEDSAYIANNGTMYAYDFVES